MAALDLISRFLPYAIGVGFIVIGLLVAAMPAPSLMKLDRTIYAWVHSARTPLFRQQIVIASFKALGGFFATSGLVYIILTLAGVSAS